MSTRILTASALAGLAVLHAPSSAQTPSTLAQIASSFVENRGQVDDEGVRFVARLGNGVGFFSDAGFVLRAHRIDAKPTPWGEPWVSGPATLDLAGGVVRGVDLFFDFVDARPAGPLTGVDRLEGHLNYLIGDRPDGWVSHVPHHRVLRSRELYPGVDLELRFGSAGLEYALAVSHEDDLDAVRLRCRGATGLRVDDSGGLVLGTDLGPVELGRPSLRVVAPSGEETERECILRPVGPGLIGFEAGPELAAGSAPEAQALVYSKYVGGEGLDEAFGLDILETGQNAKAFFCGHTFSTTTKPKFPGPFQEDLAGLVDAFVVRMWGSGNGFHYATYLGGEGVDAALDVAVDGGGRAHVTGLTTSELFPTTSGVYQTGLNGVPLVDQDAFVSILEPDGSALVHSTYFGGSADEWAFAIDLDADGSVVFGGMTLSLSDFPLEKELQGVFNGDGLLHDPPDTDGFLTKMPPDLSSLTYSTYVTGQQSEGIFDIAVDDEGRAHVAVETNSIVMLVNNPIQPFLPLGWKDNAWIGSYRVDSTLPNPKLVLDYGTFLSGDDFDSAHGIAVDDQGVLYVAGYTKSTEATFPVTAGSHDATHNGDADVWVAKIDWDLPVNGGLIWCTYVGGENGDNAWKVDLDGAGDVHVCGSTSSPDFPMAGGAYDASYNRSGDAFVLQLDPGGTALLSSTFLGGRNEDTAYDLAVEASGVDVFLTGATSSKNFPVTGLYLLPPYQGMRDAFVTKMELP